MCGPCGSSDVRVADAHPHAVRQALERVGLGCAVARHALHLERHVDRVAGAVAVVGGEVAQDAALHLGALGLHGEALGHLQRAGARDADVAVEVDDPFRGRARQRGKEEKESSAFS